MEEDYSMAELVLRQVPIKGVIKGLKDASDAKEAEDLIVSLGMHNLFQFCMQRRGHSDVSADHIEAMTGLARGCHKLPTVAQRELRKLYGYWMKELQSTGRNNWSELDNLLYELIPSNWEALAKGKSDDDPALTPRQRLAAEIGRIKVRPAPFKINGIELDEYDEFIEGKSTVKELRPSGLIDAQATGVGVAHYNCVTELLNISDCPHAFTTLVFAWQYDALLDDRELVYDWYQEAISSAASYPEHVDWRLTKGVYAKLMTGHLLLTPTSAESFRHHYAFVETIKWHSAVTNDLAKAYAYGLVPRHA